MAIKISGSTIIDDDRNIVNAGVVTATSFSGDGSALTGVGIGSEGSINTSGIITAYAVYAEEFVGTGDELIFSPTVTTFSPTDGATGVSALSSPDISITYNQPVNLGTGVTITLRKDSSTGTVAESYEVGVSTRATVSNQTLTINPTNNFDYDTDYYVVVPQGSVINNVAGNSGLLDTYNFTTEAGPVVTSFSPGIGSTDIAQETNIILTFNKNIRAGLGTITLEVGTGGTSIIESYDVSSSNRLTFSTNTLTIDPTSDLSLNTNYYVVIPDDSVAGYVGTSTYNFTTTDSLLGTAYEGGYLICQSGGTNWIVAPSSTEVSRTWYLRNDAVTTANANAACGDWFYPSQAQLQNPGYTCRTYWDSYSPTFYWANEDTPQPLNGYWAKMVSFANGNAGYAHPKTNSGCARAFRCVSY